MGKPRWGYWFMDCPPARRALDEDFFIVPVPVPVPVPDAPLGQSSSRMDSTGRQHRFRRLLSVPFSGMGTGTGTGTTEHAGTAEPGGVHGRRPSFHETMTKCQTEAVP